MLSFYMKIRLKVDREITAYRIFARFVNIHFNFVHRCILEAKDNLAHLVKKPRLTLRTPGIKFYPVHLYDSLLITAPS